MKALRVHEVGSIDNLVVDDIPSPDCGAGAIKVRVHACGINFADKLLVEGGYQEKPPTPFIPGGEIAGEVIEVGADVTGFAVGDKVMAMISLGGLAEEAVLNPMMAVTLPPQADLTEAAAFAVAYGTSHLALDHRAHLQPGETLVVLGAGGGVGLTAVEIGKLMGATVIACAGSDAKLEAAREKGADVLVNYKTEDLRERIKAETGGRGADVIYDPVGGDVFKAAMRAIAFEGRIIVIGFASGEIPQIPANILLVKNISAVGLYWGAYSVRNPDVLLKSIRQLIDWYMAGKIKPHVSATYPLAEGAEAIRALAERRSTGKVVVTSDGNP